MISNLIEDRKRSSNPTDELSAKRVCVRSSPAQEAVLHSADFITSIGQFLLIREVDRCKLVNTAWNRALSNTNFMQKAMSDANEREIRLWWRKNISNFLPDAMKNINAQSVSRHRIEVSVNLFFSATIMSAPYSVEYLLEDTSNKELTFLISCLKGNLQRLQLLACTTQHIERLVKQLPDLKELNLSFSSSLAGGLGMNSLSYKSHFS